MVTLSSRKINGLRKGLLIFLTLLLIGVSLALGAEKILWKEVFDKASFSHVIFFYSRLPRTISILMAGFGISIAGLIFQQISQNKFVSPTTAGSVSGAQLGVAISMAFFHVRSTMVMMLIAFATSMVVSFIFMGILRRLKFKELVYVPLLGLMLSSLVTALTTFLAYWHGFLQVLQGWFYGSFSLVTSGRYETLYIILPALLLAFVYAKAFTVASIGESFAINLGLDYQKTVNIGVIITALISSAVVITVGSIPFLGLVVPNIVTWYAGDHLEKNILDVGLFGMLLLLICDIISRLIVYPYEVPIALVVGVLGCGVFLVMILSKGGGQGD